MIPRVALWAAIEIRQSSFNYLFLVFIPQDDLHYQLDLAKAALLKPFCSIPTRQSMDFRGLWRKHRGMTWQVGCVVRQVCCCGVQTAAKTTTVETKEERNLMIQWSHPPGLNRRPADYESAALPAELGWPVSLFIPHAISAGSSRATC